jgi:hypothetical protein
MNETLNNFKITGRKTFIKFLVLLRKDFLDNLENWEIKKLPYFLEALCAYSEDSRCPKEISFGRANGVPIAIGITRRKQIALKTQKLD